jgi:hypothetical protein
MQTTNGKLHIDHSRRSCASSCLRKYYWRYVRNLVPLMGSNALRYGSTWHGFLDGFYSTVKEKGWDDSSAAFQEAFNEGKRTWDKESSKQNFYEDDYRTFENCTKAFLEYNNYYSGDRAMMEVIDIEKAFSIEFPQFIFDGKLDLQVELNGVNWLIERMNRAAQTIGYWNACRILGLNIEGVLISFHHLSARKVKSGEWGTLKMEFQRSPQLYCKQNVDDWLEHFTSVSQQLMDCYERDFWPKNYDSCYQYGRCGYLPLCDQFRPLGDEHLDHFVNIPWDVKNTVKEVVYAVV